MTPTASSETTTSPSDADTDRLSTLWEAERDRLSPELRAFVCRAVMFAIEKWRGIEPPRPKTSLTSQPDPRDCDHEWESFSTWEYTEYHCQKCRLVLKKQTEPPPEIQLKEYPVYPISPFAGGNIG